MNIQKSLVLSLAFLSALTIPALAHQNVKNPAVIERMDTMKAIGTAMKTLAGMAKGKIAFDAEKADLARAAIITHGLEVADKFKAPETDPATEALPAIWENWEDFVQKNEDMVNAARKVGTIAEQANLGATLGQIGGTCKACHRDYRK
jgi:cytochrome c556